MDRISETLTSFTDRVTTCYLIASGDEALLIDAGFADTPDKVIMPALASLGGPTVSQVVLTHGHGDHYEGCEAMKRHEATVAVHTLDAPLLEYHGDHTLMNGLSRLYPGLFETHGAPVACVTPDVLLEEGNTLTVGSRSLRVYHTPGHSGGSICVHDPVERIMYTGDTVSGQMIHFYLEPEVLERSLKRIRSMDIDAMAMAHAYPPVEKCFLTGSEIRDFIDCSIASLNAAASLVRELYAQDNDITARELVAEIPDVSLIAAIKLLQGAGGIPQR